MVFTLPDIFLLLFTHKMNEIAAFVPWKPDVLLDLNSRLDDRWVQIIINASHKCTGKNLNRGRICGVALMQFNFKIQILVFYEKFRRGGLLHRGLQKA